MAKTVATVLGVVFILVGIVGFISHDFLGTHLGTLHNVVHLVSGAISLYLGLKGTPSSARTFCIVFGAVYGLLGVVGFVAGQGDERMLNLPGPLDLGTMDHAVHALIGVVYLAGGLITRAETAQTAGGD